jgi:hypothetical protein
MAAIPDPTQLRQVALFRDMGLQELAILNGLMEGSSESRRRAGRRH